MRTVLCIVNPGDVSRPRGGENRAIAFAKGLKDHGFDVHLVVPKPRRKLPEELQGVKIHTVKVPSRGGSLKDQFLRALFLSRKAKKVAERNDAILQFEHSPFAGFATMIGHSSFVLDMHDLAMADPTYSRVPFYSMIFSRFEKRGIDAAIRVIVVSNPMKEIVIKEWGVSEEKIEVIPNGYFESKFKGLKLGNIEEVEGMVSFLGTLHLKLDINKIIYLAKSLKNSKIYIIGDGPARIELERRIKEYNLKNVFVTRWLPDNEAYRYIAKSQVVIYPIKKLNLHTKILTSVKIFDYSALGKAMVLDDVSESEIWREYKEKNAAMFSNPDNPKEFVNCVQVLLEDEKLRRRMGLRAKKIARKYTWEKMGERLVKLYKEVLE